MVSDVVSQLLGTTVELRHYAERCSLPRTCCVSAQETRLPSEIVLFPENVLKLKHVKQCALCLS